MKKNIGMLVGLAAMMGSIHTSSRNDYHLESESPEEKPKVIPNGCKEYTFFGHTVIAISRKSAKKKCAKLAKLNTQSHEGD